MDESTPVLKTKLETSVLFDKYQYLLDKTYAESMYDYLFDLRKYHLEKSIAQVLLIIREIEVALFKEEQYIKKQKAEYHDTLQQIEEKKQNIVNETKRILARKNLKNTTENIRRVVSSSAAIQKEQFNIQTLQTTKRTFDHTSSSDQVACLKFRARRDMLYQVVGEWTTALRVHMMNTSMQHARGIDIDDVLNTMAQIRREDVADSKALLFVATASKASRDKMMLDMNGKEYAMESFDIIEMLTEQLKPEQDPPPQPVALT